MKTKQLQKYACSIWHRGNNVQQVNSSKKTLALYYIYSLDIHFKNKYLKLLPHILNFLKRITKGI
jgi:hypothetical protein